MDKKSEFVRLFGIKSIEQFFFRNSGFGRNETIFECTCIHNLPCNGRVYFQGSYSTFSECSRSLSHCRVNSYTFSFVKRFLTPANSIPLSTQTFSGRYFSVAIVKKARIVSLGKFDSILFSSTFLSNELVGTLHCCSFWLIYQHMTGP